MGRREGRDLQRPQAPQHTVNQALPVDRKGHRLPKADILKPDLLNRIDHRAVGFGVAPLGEIKRKKTVVEGWAESIDRKAAARFLTFQQLKIAASHPIGIEATGAELD